MASLLKQFTSKEHGPFVQFIKYSVWGGIATAVHIICFSLMAALVLPALTSREFVVQIFHLSVPDISDSLRAQRAALDNAAAFLFSNLAAYIVNILWVFKQGRHHWALEFLLFFAVSAVSMVVGTAIQSFLISHHGLTTTVAFGGNLVAAILINYAMRKFVIFRG